MNPSGSSRFAVSAVRNVKMPKPFCGQLQGRILEAGGDYGRTCHFSFFMMNVRLAPPPLCAQGFHHGPVLPAHRKWAG
jgi:hypothetical protein